jgi:hypothetical protein
MTPGDKTEICAKATVVAWMSGALLCFHIVGAAALVTAMWEQYRRDESSEQSAGDLLRLLAEGMCSTVKAEKIR